MDRAGANLQTYLRTINVENTNQAPYLNAVNSSLNTILNDSNMSLIQQYDMNDIVSQETDRLDLKKTQVDNALIGKNRMIALNESYKEKYERYNTIAIVIVITLAVLILLIIFQRFFIFIPSAIFDLLIAILLALSGIYIIWIVVDILSRDNMNFAELNLRDPAIVNGNLSASGPNNNYLNMNYCVGSDCCKNDTVWDSTIGQCHLPCKQGTIWTVIEENTNSAGNIIKATGSCRNSISS